MQMIDWILIGMAFATAVLSGVAGIGGGTVLIGTMLALGLPPVVAVPLHAAVQMASNTSRAVAYASHLYAPAALWFCVAAVPAAFLVAPLVAAVDPDWIRLAMAAFIIYALLPHGQRLGHLPERRAMLLAGGATGGIGAVVGATGVLISPLFLRPNWSSERTVGTLALCQGLGHLAKIVAFATIGYALLDRPVLLAGMLVAVVSGTFVGRALHGRVSPAGFKRLFRLILAVLCAKLLWDVLGSLMANS